MEKDCGGPDRQRTCLLVLGMRSGTSALARCLSLLGAGLPAHLLPGNHSNETGHWEPARIVELNDRILAAVGSRWDALLDPDLNLLAHDVRIGFRDELTDTVAREYGDAPFIVLKEPRIGRLVPFYVEALRDAGYELRVIVTRRDPVAVARSFEKRDGNGLGHALLLWISYALSVEHSTRALERTFVSYDELMLDPLRVLSSASAALGIAYPRPLPDAIEAIRTYLSSELYHNKPGEHSAPDFVADAHDALDRLAGRDPSAMSVLDRQRNAVHRLVGRFGTLIGRDTSLSRLAELAAESG